MIPHIETGPRHVAGLPPGAFGHTGQNSIRPQANTCLVKAFTDILIGPRTRNTVCFLDSIIAKTRPHQDLSATEPDVILMDMFRFRPELLPQFDNTICAELGRLVEQLVTSVFTATRGSLVIHGNTGLDHLESDYEAAPEFIKKSKHKRRMVKWKFPDFQLAGDTLIEVKYRFNSYQNKQVQIEVAHAYRKLGKKPVFLHISPDCQQIDDFLAAGWEVHVGQDAMEYIAEHTGVDFQAILRRVAAQPAIKARLDEGQALIESRMTAQHLRDFEFGTEGMREAIYDRIASSDRHTAEIVKRRGDLAEEMLDDIRRKTEESMDDKIENLTDLDRHIDEIGQISGIFGNMNNEQKAELLSRLGPLMTDDLRDRFIAEWG